MKTQTVAPTPPKRKLRLVVHLMAASLLMVSAQSAWAQTAPSLGTAKSFAVLAGSTVTNTGPSTIKGDLGVHPGTAVTGFPPGILLPPGTMHAADAVALQAQSDLGTAYNALAGQALTSDKTGQDLGGQTLVAGVYKFTSSAFLTGTLTLNAKGNASAVFIFQIASTLITASSADVKMINGGQPCNVFWQVGSSATIGTYSSFTGNILALTSIGLKTGASLNGRALARNGAVTLETNNIFFSSCAAGTSTGDTGDIPGAGDGGPTPPPIIAGPGPICVERVGPTVRWGQLSDTQWTATVRDGGSGLASIVVDQATTSNATLTIPIFPLGTTSPVVVIATQVLAGVPVAFGVKATDVCGNVTWWDPVSFTITANETVTFNGIDRIEHFVTIENDGLQALYITVNGIERTLWLRPGADRTINIGEMMSPGADNTITFEAVGFGGRVGQAKITVRPK